MSDSFLDNYEVIDKNIDSLEKTIKELQGMASIIGVFQDYDNDIMRSKGILKEYANDINSFREVVRDKEKELEELKERINEKKEMIKGLDKKREDYQKEKRRLELDKEQLVKTERELNKDLSKCRNALVTLDKGLKKTEEESVKEILFDRFKNDKVADSKDKVAKLIEDVVTRGNGNIKLYINNILDNLKKYNEKDETKKWLNKRIYREVEILEEELNERFKYKVDDDTKIQIDKIILNQLDNIFTLAKYRMKYYNLKQIKKLESFNDESIDWYIKKVDDKLKISDNDKLERLSKRQVKDILVSIKIEESKKYDEWQYTDGINEKKYMMKNSDEDFLDQVVKWSFDTKNKYINDMMNEKMSQLDLERMKKETKDKKNESIELEKGTSNSKKADVSLYNKNFNKLKNHTYMLHTVFSVGEEQRNQLLKDDKIKKAYSYVEKVQKKESQLEDIFKIYSSKKLCEDYLNKDEREKLKILKALDNYCEIVNNIMNYENDKAIERKNTIKKLEEINNSEDKESIESLKADQSKSKKYLKDKLNEMKDIRVWLGDKLTIERKLKSNLVNKLEDSFYKLAFIDGYNFDGLDQIDHIEMKDIIDEVSRIENLGKLEKITKTDSQVTLVDEGKEIESTSRRSSKDTLVEKQKKGIGRDFTM